MKFVNKLFKYNYVTYSQGTEDIGVEYALLYVPKYATFANNKSTLYQARQRDGFYEINYDSIEDLTINF